MSTKYQLTLAARQTTQEGRPITLYVAELLVPTNRQRLTVSSSSPEETARGLAKLIARGLAAED